ncbi:cutinase family protein [Nocardia sp. NPDC004582]
MNPLLRGGAAVVSVAATALLVAAPGTASADEPPSGECPVLYTLGVQGTGESSPDAAPSTDTGMLSLIMKPFLAASQDAGVRVDRAYVPYEASFGGATPGGQSSYSNSVTGGESKLAQMAGDFLKHCPNSRLAVLGYSQGANVASVFAQNVGAGKGSIPADKIAAVALFGDPTRNTGATVFPGAPDRKSPTAAPGSAGSAVNELEQIALTTTASGGGIGTEGDKAVSYGKLAGRVASFCAAGDLACDAPDKAPILHAIANIAGQAEFGGDPIRAIGSIVQSLAMTGIKTVTNVVNNDISGNSLANLSISPKKSISKRLEEASDPRSQLDPNSVLTALFKVGSIAVNSAITVAKTILTPANIAEIATAGLADPVAGLLAFGTKLVGALPQLMPPTTGIKLISQVFTAFTENLKDNSDMLLASTWTKYGDVLARHGSYQHDPVTTDGKPATAFVADWLVAAARDINGAVASVKASGSAVPTSGTPKPSASQPSSPAPSGTKTPWVLELAPSRTSPAPGTPPAN